MRTAWITAFVDVPASRYAVTASFWAGVTGSSISRSRGADEQFATFVPPDGDDYLRIQRIESGAPGIHLDLHTPDGDLTPTRSPGGLLFCLNEGETGTRPIPRIWAAGHTSLVDQVTLDIPPALYDAECAFWAETTGWELHQGSRPEFHYLTRADAMPLRILLQRLDEGDDPVRAHLDIATSDRAEETERHRGLGARVETTRQNWTVLRDPAGSLYCITDRDPYTGTL